MLNFPEALKNKEDQTCPEKHFDLKYKFQPEEFTQPTAILCIVYVVITIKD